MAFALLLFSAYTGNCCCWVMFVLCIFMIFFYINSFSFFPLYHKYFSCSLFFSFVIFYFIFFEWYDVLPVRPSVGPFFPVIILFHLQKNVMKKNIYIHNVKKVYKRGWQRKKINILFSRLEISAVQCRMNWFSVIIWACSILHFL